MPPALLQDPLKSSCMPSDPVTVIVHELLLQQLWCLCEGHHSKGKFPSGNLSQWICNKKLATGIMRPTYPTFKHHWLPHISTPSQFTTKLFAMFVAGKLYTFALFHVPLKWGHRETESWSQLDKKKHWGWPPNASTQNPRSRCQEIQQQHHQQQQQHQQHEQHQHQQQQ